jgi:hypothetical protein
MKRALFVIAGVLWLAFALGFGLVLLNYLRSGAGVQSVGGMFSSGNVLLGVAHVIGFCFAALVCLGIGAGLFARGISSRDSGSDGFGDS